MLEDRSIQPETLQRRPVGLGALSLLPGSLLCRGPHAGRGAECAARTQQGTRQRKSLESSVCPPPSIPPSPPASQGFSPCIPLPLLEEFLKTHVPNFCFSIINTFIQEQAPSCFPLALQICADKWWVINKGMAPGGPGITQQRGIPRWPTGLAAGVKMPGTFSKGGHSEDG